MVIVPTVDNPFYDGAVISLQDNKIMVVSLAHVPQMVVGIPMTFCVRLDPFPVHFFVSFHLIHLFFSLLSIGIYIQGQTHR